MPAQNRPATIRLDLLLVDRGLAESRAKAQALVLAGRVSSAGVRLDKAGMRIAADRPLEVRPGRRWVGRGGHKLFGAFDLLDVDATARDALDVGASTGGFTQVLLESGARSVIALDVGRGQLDWSLRGDPRVVVLEGINARYLCADDLPISPDLAVIDVSFISLELILPPVVACLEAPADVVALIKPQFELERGQVGRGGIVRRPELHRLCLERKIEFVARRGWHVGGLCASPLAGADGNREFFVHLSPERPALDDATLAAQLERTLEPLTDSPDDRAGASR